MERPRSFSACTFSFSDSCFACCSTRCTSRISSIDTCCNGVSLSFSRSCGKIRVKSYSKALARWQRSLPAAVLAHRLQQLASPWTESGLWNFLLNTSEVSWPTKAAQILTEMAKLWLKKFYLQNGDSYVWMPFFSRRTPCAYRHLAYQGRFSLACTTLGC